MKQKRKGLMIFVCIIMVISMVGILAFYWYNSNHFISTEDAKVDSDLLKINAQISGKLLEFNVKEGSMVDKGEIIGRQEMTAQSDSILDTSLIRSPIKGLIIKKQSNEGEILTAGQVLGYVVDTNNIYITANIEETKVNKLNIGEKVDITIDKYKDKRFTGKVDSIGESSISKFSLLPTSTSANFTKVVEKVPVKIKLNNTSGVKLLPGINAAVKIHLK